MGESDLINHGAHAKVGDLVECLTPQGAPSGITGLVSKVILNQPFGDFDDHNLQMRFLEITGLLGNTYDSYVIIRSRASR